VRGRRGAAPALALLGVAVALVAGGCELLMDSGGFGNDFPAPSQIASFSTGHATIAIAGGETIELDKVDATSGIQTLMGSDVRWTGDDGWSLQVNGAGADFPDNMGGLDTPAFLALDRIQDGNHWTTYDPSRCVVTVDVADKTGVRGSATCKGVEWFDALTGPSFTQPKPVDQPKFDAEITFEAAP
jgi:hypothetical protein